ncbi:MAG: insulinase family protein [Candidatus Moraniibacteriota bacterium]|nr:MAG: insulinase family protein [Candidatus Moranbacteria bacterium]
MQYEKHVLPNGLRVILAPMKEAETVTVLITTATGSRYETKKEGGLSHFLEHMFFKGTKRRPTAISISEELDAVGGEYNAFTSKDRTAYYAKVDKKHAEMALDIVSDIFLNSTLPAEEIDRERGPILQELNMYEDTPMRHVGDIFEILLYGDHPLGRDIIGTRENIKGFKRAEFLRYLNRAYVASNVVVGVAGNFDAAWAKEVIERDFSGMRTGKNPDRKGMVEKQKSPAVLLQTKKTDQTHFILGVRSFDFFHEDRHALAVLSTLLGGGMSSRLFVAVRERRGLAYSVRTGTDAYHDAGYLSTQCGVEHENLEKTIAVILEEYKRIATELVPEKELMKAKEHIKGSMAMHLESSDDIVGYLVDQEVLKGEIVLPEDRYAKIDSVTGEDVRRVAGMIFRPDRLNLAVIGPQKSAKKLEKILTL